VLAKKRRAKRKRITEGLKRLQSGGKSGKYIKTAKIAADKLVKNFESRYGIKLEYKMDDVRSLDRELEKNYESNTLTPEEIVWMGYYLGELLRRNVGGEYEFREDPGVLVLKCLNIVAFPILKMQKALHEKRPRALESYVFLFAKKVSDKKARRAKE
jgi:hypothetical protein